MKLYERIENNNFNEIDKNRAIELIENGNGHLIYNENYFKLQKENEELRAKWDKDTHILQNKLDYANADRIDLTQQNKELRKENEGLNNRCRNLDKEAQAYLEELAGDNTLTRRTIKQLQKENEECKLDVQDYLKQAQENAEMYRKAQKKIQDLKAENEELKNKLNLKQFDVNIVYNDYLEKLDEYERNTIPIQRIKDIIDRIDYDIKKTKEIISKNTNIYASYRKNDYQIVRLKAMNTKSLDIKKRLQELLDGSDADVGSIESEE